MDTRMGATSWQLEAIERLQRKKGVYTVIADQCLYGQEGEELPGRSRRTSSYEDDVFDK